MTEQYEDPKLYTMLKCHDLDEEGRSMNCLECEHNGCITMPNKPVSVPNKEGYVIVTGIFKKAPQAEFLSQREAELIMTVEETSPP